MRMDARKLFLAALAAFVLMLGWRGAVELRPDPPDPFASGTDRPQITPHEPLGILDYIQGQLDPAHRTVPVSPFRPTAEAMTSNDVPVVALGTNTPSFTGWDPLTFHPPSGLSTNEATEVVMENGKWVRRPRYRTPRTPRLIYKGLFTRSDGKTVAHVRDTVSRKTTFYSEGDTLCGATILAVSKERLQLRLPDGSLHNVKLNRSVQVAQPKPAATKTPATTVAPAYGPAKPPKNPTTRRRHTTHRRPVKPETPPQ